MTRNPRIAACSGALIVPCPALAHDAFGDLGPFYANLLHPFADPAQGLLIVGAAVLLARQPLGSVRPAFAWLVLAGAVTVLISAFVPMGPPGIQITGMLAAALGLAALFGLTLGPVPATVVAIGIAVAAGLAIELPSGVRAAGLSAFGAILGIALAALLTWGLLDLAMRRLGRVAVAMAGSWVAAVGILSAALPGGG